MELFTCIFKQSLRSEICLEMMRNKFQNEGNISFKIIFISSMRLKEPLRTDCGYI